MKSYLYYCIFIPALINFTHGREKVDVQAEINKIAGKFEKFDKPSPEVIENLVEQIEASCRTNHTFNKTFMNNMSICLNDFVDQTELTAQVKEAIPKGDLDDVFRKVCLKWPNAKTCFKDGFEVIEECWENGNKMTVALDSMVGFFCEKDNSGARIALFFAEGGLSCLETNGEAVKTCVNEYINVFSDDDLCVSVSQIHECLAPLRKCKDVTPENLISSMVKQVGIALNCPPLVDPHTGGHMTDGVGATSPDMVVIPSICLMSVIAFIVN